jgi:hypothetical protein
MLRYLPKCGIGSPWSLEGEVVVILRQLKASVPTICHRGSIFSRVLTFGGMQGLNVRVNGGLTLRTSVTWHLKSTHDYNGG